MKWITRYDNVLITAQTKEELVQKLYNAITEVAA